MAPRLLRYPRGPKRALQFSLFSLIKLHLASHPLASSYSHVAVSSVFCAQYIHISAQTRGVPLRSVVSIHVHLQRNTCHILLLYVTPYPLVPLMHSKMSRAAFQRVAFGAVQYLPTARTTFEISGCVDVDSHIRLRTNSRKDQFSTSLSLSGTLCMKITRTFFTSSLAVFAWDKYRQITPIPVLRVVVGFITCQFPETVDENFEVKLVSNHITLSNKSYSKDVIEVHSHNDHYTSLLNQTKNACIGKPLLKA